MRGEKFMLAPWHWEEEKLRSAISYPAVNGGWRVLTFPNEISFTSEGVPAETVTATEHFLSAETLVNVSLLLAKNLAYVTTNTYVEWIRAITTIWYHGGDINGYVSALKTLAETHGVPKAVIMPILFAGEGQKP